MMPPRNSQLWPFLYWLTGLFAISFVLWLTATNFDETEGRAIGLDAVITALLLMLIEVIRRKAGNKDSGGG